MKSVTGTFAYDQNVTTQNVTISTVFSKEAQTLCASLPDYGVTQTTIAMSITGPNGMYSGTVADMADKQGAASTLMGCACATNTSGGGAIMNAHVSVVPLAAIMAMAGANA